MVSSDSESDSDILSVDYSFSSDEESVDGFQWYRYILSALVFY